MQPVVIEETNDLEHFLETEENDKKPSFKLNDSDLRAHPQQRNKRFGQPPTILAGKMNEFNEEYFGLTDQRFRRFNAKPMAHSSPKNTLENKSESILSVPEEYPTIVTEQEDALGPELS